MQKLKLAELNRLSKTDFIHAEKNKIIIVADNIRSAMNVGSLFRTADAFLIEEIILVGITAQPPNREILKTALGATETVQWKYHKNATETIQYLRENEYNILCVEQIKESIFLQNYAVNHSEKYALIFGNEVDGVHQQFLDNCNSCLEIPQLGSKHSLNVSVCAGIVVWHFINKL